MRTDREDLSVDEPVLITAIVHVAQCVDGSGGRFITLDRIVTTVFWDLM